MIGRRARTATLPLGIDWGRTRVRVALAERSAGGVPTLLAVAARDFDALEPAAALAAAVAELGTRERRCVFGIAEPEALLRRCTLPPMSRREQLRAARFEAARLIEYALEEAEIALAAASAAQQPALLGIARRSAIAARLAAAKHARLARPLAIDDLAFALGRVHPNADGAIDVADAHTRLIIFSPHDPQIASIPIGGRHFTAAIARALGLGDAAAEARKRTVGFGGAGEWQRDELALQLGSALAAAAPPRTPVHLVVTGNGARVPGLCETLERALGCAVRLAELSHVPARIPADVLRAAGPDWSAAYGLALWGCAA